MTNSNSARKAEENFFWGAVLTFTGMTFIVLGLVESSAWFVAVFGAVAMSSGLILLVKSITGYIDYAASKINTNN